MVVKLVIALMAIELDTDFVTRLVIEQAVSFVIGLVVTRELDWVVHIINKVVVINKVACNQDQFIVGGQKEE